MSWHDASEADEISKNSKLNWIEIATVTYDLDQVSGKAVKKWKSASLIQKTELRLPLNHFMMDHYWTAQNYNDKSYRGWENEIWITIHKNKVILRKKFTKCGNGLKWLLICHEEYWRVWNSWQEINADLVPSIVSCSGRATNVMT